MDVDEEVRQLHAHLRLIIHYRECFPEGGRPLNWRLAVYCADEETLNLVRNSIPYTLQKFIAEWKVIEPCQHSQS